RVPFIARWPGHIKSGIESRALFSTVDIFASLAMLVDQTLPKDAAPDSMNVLPALLGEAGAKGRDALVMHAGNGALAIRLGPWKVIPAPAPATGKNKQKALQATELYNLAEDLTETNNLAAANPAKVKELTSLLNTIRESGRSSNSK